MQSVNMQNGHSSQGAYGRLKQPWKHSPSIICPPEPGPEQVRPVGLSVYGYSPYVSYAYPGGIALD